MMSVASWFIVALALTCANVPFINQRVLAVAPLAKDIKSGWVRIAELSVLYFAVGTLGFVLESHLGNRVVQGWQFYTVTFALFIVFAFPGFTYQYLIKRR